MIVHEQEDIGPIAWIRSLSDATRIFPLRSNPHPTTIGRHDDCDVIFTSQSISRHHCTIQLATNAVDKTNAQSVAVLKDASFNGCFVGDDLVRNRAEWLAAGDVIRFGNDKEKFILETITTNTMSDRHTNQASNEYRHVDQPTPLSPVDERRQHGGPAAGYSNDNDKHRHHVLQQQQPVRNNYNNSRRQQLQQPKQSILQPHVPWSQIDNIPPRPTSYNPTNRQSDEELLYAGAGFNSFGGAGGGRNDENFDYNNNVESIPHQNDTTRQNSTSQALPIQQPFIPPPDVEHFDKNVDVTPLARSIYGGSSGGIPPPHQSHSQAWASTSVPSSPSKNQYHGSSSNNRGGGLHSSLPNGRSVRYDASGDASGDEDDGNYDDNLVLDSIDHNNGSGGGGERERRNNAWSNENDDGNDDNNDNYKIPPPPALPTGSLPPLFNNDNNDLTQQQRSKIELEKQMCAKHMKEINMVLAGTRLGGFGGLGFVFDRNVVIVDGEEKKVDADDADNDEKQTNKPKDNMMYLLAKTLRIYSHQYQINLLKALNKWRLHHHIHHKTSANEAKNQRGLSDHHDELLKKNAIETILSSHNKNKRALMRYAWNTWSTIISHSAIQHVKRELRSVSRGFKVMNICNMIDSKVVQGLWKAWFTWRKYIQSANTGAGLKKTTTIESLTKKYEASLKKVDALNKQTLAYKDELTYLKSTSNFAAALSTQQKVVTALRRQLGRSERGWFMECNAFAAASCVGGYEYAANNDVNVNSSSVGGSKFKGLQQRKKQTQNNVNTSTNLKEKTLPSSIRNNAKVRKVQAYLTTKSRECSTLRLEASEWRRRAELSNRRWSLLTVERDDALKSFESGRESWERSSGVIMDMVRERDARITRLQENLVKLAGAGAGAGKGEEKLVGVLKGGKGSSTANANASAMKASQTKTKKHLAIEFLSQEFTAMQTEVTKRSQGLVDELIELRGLLRSGGGSSGGGVDSRMFSPNSNNQSTTRLTLTNTHLQTQIKTLQDELTDLEIQGGVRALMEAKELVDALQVELAACERKCRVLVGEVERVGRVEDRDGGGGGGKASGLVKSVLSRSDNFGETGAVSGESVSSLIGDDVMDLDEEGGDDDEGEEEDEEDAAGMWGDTLDDTERRLKEAEEGYEREGGGSGGGGEREYE